MRDARLGRGAATIFARQLARSGDGSLAKLPLVPRRSNLNGDIMLAVAAIAAEFGVDVECAPVSVTGILRTFSAAHYAAGVRDTMVRLSGHQALIANEPIPSSTEITPIVGPHGRRIRVSERSAVPLSRRPTPLVPPPHGIDDDDDEL